MQRALVYLTLLAAACSRGKPAPTSDREPTPTPKAVAQKSAEVPVPLAEPKAPPVDSPYGPDIQSLRVTKPVTVYREPDASSAVIGVIDAETRLSWAAFSDGPGCKRWVGLDPEGWVCDKSLEPSKREPYAIVQPKMKEGKFIPGIYGKVSGEDVKVYRTEDEVLSDEGTPLNGTMTVRMAHTVVIDERNFWLTKGGYLVERTNISKLAPPKFSGVVDPTLPCAWSLDRENDRKKVPVRAAADPAAKFVRELPARTPLPVLEESADGHAIRIGEGEWVSTKEVRIARAAPPPPLLSHDERWIDVDLDQQVLVAYEGTRPIFATLISSGRTKAPTPTGVYRIEAKFPEDDMVNDPDMEDVYSVERVPWAMYFTTGLALHAAYWHDGYGVRKSHGCVNLSPKDAHYLYDWAAPAIHPGWISSRGSIDRPGTVVRIRDGAPDDEVKGYARKLLTQAATPAEPGQ